PRHRRRLMPVVRSPQIVGPSSRTPFRRPPRYPGRHYVAELAESSAGRITWWRKSMRLPLPATRRTTSSVCRRQQTLNEPSRPLGQSDGTRSVPTTLPGDFEPSRATRHRHVEKNTCPRIDLSMNADFSIPDMLQVCFDPRYRLI